GGPRGRRNRGSAAYPGAAVGAPAQGSPARPRRGGGGPADQDIAAGHAPIECGGPQIGEPVVSAISAPRNRRPVRHDGIDTDSFADVLQRLEARVAEGDIGQPVPYGAVEVFGDADSARLGYRLETGRDV